MISDDKEYVPFCKIGLKTFISYLSHILMYITFCVGSNRNFKHVKTESKLSENEMKEDRRAKAKPSATEGIG